MKFRSGEHSYKVDETGIHQINPQPFVYDANYCATYDTEAYRTGNENLQNLRLAFIIGAFGAIPESLCDVGFGNGAFLKKAKSMIPKLYGKDVSGVEIEGVEMVDNYPVCDVITFHDVLEHIHDLSFLSFLMCDMVVVSCPCCHAYFKTEFIEEEIEWFTSWKHKKPNEHVHHLNLLTLEALMKKHHFKKVAVSFHEDLVRTPVDGRANILTMAFKRI